MTGIVKFFNARRGMGFIEPLIGRPGAKHIYFHATSVKGIKLGEQAGVPVGAEVRFDLCRGELGPQAANLEVVKISAAVLWPTASVGANDGEIGAKEGAYQNK
jgi:cold shock CspA family protein